MLQIIFLVVFSASLGGIFFFFLRKNKLLRTEHLQAVSALQDVIKINREQIFFRSEMLDRYHFLKYNLEEALLIQKEISVKNPS